MKLFSRNVKNDFPIFQNRPTMVYLDSAATSLKPREVIAKEQEYAEHYSANIHRGLYDIAEEATREFEQTRREVAAFIHAGSVDEVVFTRGTTESLNMIAHGLTEAIKPGDEIVISIAEHHSNFVPWQELAKRTGAILKFIDIDKYGKLCLEESDRTFIDDNPHIGSLQKILSSRTKILALALVSNVLGTIHPIKEILALTPKLSQSVITVIDAAQAVPHMPVDVYDLNCDFLAFSGHKMLGPTGVGVLWGKKKYLEMLRPLNFGGEMIDDVRVTGTTYRELPHRLEAGTPNISGVIALKPALWYLSDYGMKHVMKHEHELTAFAMTELKNIFGKDIVIFGPENAKDRVGNIAFTFYDFHPHDIAALLNEQGIAVRAGHHCAKPLHERLGLVASTRISFYLYNTKDDVLALIKGLSHVKEVLGK